jgi:hypothetical protein
MRVLIAGHSLDYTGGLQAYERDLALWLIERGHSPVIYATLLGEAARLLERRAVPVVDDLSKIGAPPDIIHGDSAIETVAALLRFPAAPALFVCHSAVSALASPPRFSRVRRYVAVDDACADRLVLREGIAPADVSVLLNAVNLDRFCQRPPLPERPRRAIVFGNLAHELMHVAAVREACSRASIAVDVVGALAGSAVSDPESVLGGYDLAFAKGKAAIEAMACGLAVILCDGPGLGALVRSDDFDRLRRLNFGIRTLTRPVTADAVAGELARYDAADALRVSDRIRATASSDSMYEVLATLYETVIAEQRGGGDWHEESLAASRFLHDIARREREQEMSVTTLGGAANRVLQIPLIGAGIARAARWLTRRS